MLSKVLGSLGTGAVGFMMNGLARALTQIEVIEAAQTWAREVYNSTPGSTSTEERKQWYT